MAYALAAVPTRSTTLAAIPARIRSSLADPILRPTLPPLPNLGRRKIGPRMAVGETVIGMGRLPMVQDRYRNLGASPSGAAIGAAAGSVIPVIGTAAGSIIGTITGGLFHSSAAGPNAAAANAVAPEVAKGNLAAVAAVITRNGIQTQSSLAPWKALLATIPPGLIAAANAQFPGNNWSIFGAIDPSQVLPTVQRLAVYATPGSYGSVAAYQPPVGPGTSAGSSIISSMAAGFFGTPAGSQVLQTGVPAIAKGAAQSALQNPLVLMSLAGAGLLVAKLIFDRPARRAA